MPLFSSIGDDKLTDNERRLSARSLTPSTCYGSSRFNLSSRSYDTSINSVRLVNSAVSIENNDSLVDASDVNCANMSETRSDIVPPLDIKSEENYPIRDYTFSYRKHCEADKIVLKPDKAFETWLSAKRKVMSDEAARRKKEEEMKQKELQERKRLAKEKYDLWLEKKSQSSLVVESTDSITSDMNLKNKTRSKFPAEEARARLEKWEREKRLIEERRRMLKQQEEQRRRELEEQRRQMSVEAWQNWIANADKKPKPVPLNRGIFTLRGTISDIYVNPNEWKPIIQLSNGDDQ